MGLGPSTELSAHQRGAHSSACVATGLLTIFSEVASIWLICGHRAAHWLVRRTRGVGSFAVVEDTPPPPPWLDTMERRDAQLAGSYLALDQDMYCANQSSMGCGRRWNSR